MSQLNEKHEAVELDAMKPDEGGMADGRHNIPDIVVLRPVEDIEEDTDVDKGGADHAVHSGPKHDGNKTGIATRARQKPSIITRLVTANFNAKTKIAVVALLFFGIFLLMAAFAVGLGAYAVQLEQLRAEVHGMPYVSTVTAVPTTGLAESDLEVSNGHRTVVFQRMEYPHFPRGVDMYEATVGDFAEETFTTTIPVMTLFVNSTTTTSMTMTMTATTTSMVDLSLSSPQASGAVVGPVNTSDPVVVVPLTNLTIAVPLGTVQGSMTTTTTTSTTTGTSLSSSSPSSTESCGEWGDGAGPCARPYGAPNATPASVLESMITTATSSLANLGGGEGAGAGAGVSQMALTTTLLPSVPINSTSSVAFTTSFSDASILDAPTETPVAPTVTVTVTSNVNNGTCGILGITETVATAAQSSPTTSTTRRTIYVTSTSINLITSTLGASDGGPLLTVTETAYWSNSTTAFKNSTSPASTANFTLTLKSIATPGAGFGGPNGGYGNGSLRGSVAPTVFTPVSSGGEKKVTPPKGMGANGSSGGGTGAGVYCVMMLVALVALLG